MAQEELQAPRMARRALLDRIVYSLLKHQLVAVTAAAETLVKRPEVTEVLAVVADNLVYLRLVEPATRQQQFLAKVIMGVQIIRQAALMVAVAAAGLQRQAEMDQELLADLVATEQLLLFQVHL